MTDERPLKTKIQVPSHMMAMAKRIVAEQEKKFLESRPYDDPPKGVLTMGYGMTDKMHGYGGAPKMPTSSRLRADVSFAGLRASVEYILRRDFDRALDIARRRIDGHNTLMGKWTVQGFGMLRTYFGPDDCWRLNIWAKRFENEDVSTIHDHPWHFDSIILAGRFRNKRYVVKEAEPGQTIFNYGEVLKAGMTMGERGFYATHAFKRILTGPKADDSHDGVADGYVKLTGCPVEQYGPGDVYSQHHSEVHESAPDDLCVTLNKRERVDGSQHARVFWPVGSEWVTARPRNATAAEVADTLRDVIENWDRVKP